MSPDPFESLRGRARGATTTPVAVDAVIAAGRRRRVRALVGGGAGTTVLVGLLILALSGGGGAPQTLDVIDDPSPPVTTASEEPGESTSPESSASASGSASASASAEPDASPGGTDVTAGPTPSESYDPSYWTRTFNDGKPGWSGGYGGCGVGHEPGPQPAIGRTMTGETVLPRTAWRPGERLDAFVVVTNRGTQRQEEEASTAHTRGLLRDSNGKSVSAVYFTDAIQPEPIALDPGESTRMLVSANTVICGDGPEDPEPPLPPGDYTLAFYMGGLGWTEPVTVTLDPAASQRSVWPMQPRAVPRRVGRSCADAPEPTTTVDGFDLAVELASGSVASGGTLGATVVVTATTAKSLPTDPRGNPAYVDGLTSASSTGVDPGPFPQPGYRDARQARDDAPQLRPGDSLRYPVSWVAQSCPSSGTGEGTDLAPGAYDVRFGLLVIDGTADRKFWLTKTTYSVTVTV